MPRSAAKLIERPELLLPLAPIVAYLAPKGLWIPGSLMALWWLVLMGLGRLPSQSLLCPKALARLNPALWLIVGLAALSPLWAIDPSFSAIRSARFLFEALTLVTLALGAASLPPERVSLPLRLSLLSAGIIGCLCALDVLSQGSLSFLFRRPMDNAMLAVSYSRGGVFHALLLPAATLGCWRIGARRTALLGASLGLAAVFANYSGTARGALMLSVLVGAGVAAWPTLRHCLAPGFAAAVLLMPVLIPPPGSLLYCRGAQYLGGSTEHRMLIWDFVVTRIQERPWLGWGIESARAIPGGHDPISPAVCSGKAANLCISPSMAIAGLSLPRIARQEEKRNPLFSNEVEIANDIFPREKSTAGVLRPSQEYLGRYAQSTEKPLLPPSCTLDGKLPPLGESLPLHPHNGALQIWLELGAVGAIFAAGAVFLAIRRGLNSTRSRLGLATVAAATTSAFFTINYSFGVWQSWLIGGIGLVLVIVRLTTTPTLSRPD